MILCTCIPMYTFYMYTYMYIHNEFIYYTHICMHAFMHGCMYVVQCNAIYCNVM